MGVKEENEQGVKRRRMRRRISFWVSMEDGKTMAFDEFSAHMEEVEAVKSYNKRKEKWSGETSEF